MESQLANKADAGISNICLRGDSGKGAEEILKEMMYQLRS